MNVAEHQFFSFWAGGQQAYVPLMHVREVARGLPFTPVSGGARGVCGMVNLRGHVLTAISPQGVWGGGVPGLWAADSLNMIVVHAGTLYSFLIDRYGDVETVLASDIELLTAQSGIWHNIASGLFAKDGRAVPLLAVPQLLAYVEQGITHREQHHEKMPDR